MIARILFYVIMGHFVMNPNEFCFEVLNVVIARVPTVIYHWVMHQNKFSFQVLYEVIARTDRIDRIRKTGRLTERQADRQSDRQTEQQRKTE